MLVLSRKIGDAVVMPDSRTRIEILSVSRGRVRVGIDAPVEFAVHREEMWRKISDRVGPIAGLRARASGHVEVLWLDDGTSESPECLSDPLPNCLVHLTVVRTVRACIEQLVNKRPDLLAIDLDVVNGHLPSVLQILRGDKDLSLIPVILIGRGAPCDEQHDLGVTIVDRLRKPMDGARLAEGVRALFSYSNWRKTLSKEGCLDGGSKKSESSSNGQHDDATPAASLSADSHRHSGDKRLATSRTHPR